MDDGKKKEVKKKKKLRVTQLKSSSRTGQLLVWRTFIVRNPNRIEFWKMIPRNNGMIKTEVQEI